MSSQLAQSNGFTTLLKPRWTAAEVVALIDSLTKIENLTGFGHRNYMSIGSGGGIIYPDGIERVLTLQDTIVMAPDITVTTKNMKRN